MNEFEKDLLRNVFAKRFGLKETLLDAAKENDKLLLEAIIDSLSQQSGLRAKFIKDNINEIIKLC